MVATELKPKNDGESLKVAKVVLKRRDRNLAANAERAKTIQAMRKMRKSKPKTITAVHGDVLLKKAKCSKMDREHVIVSKVKRRFERQIPADAKCLLVARNERFPDFPRAKEALKKLGLLPQNACRIITTSPENLERIRACDAYIFYGVPTPETVSTLVHKKAYMENPAKPQGEKKASSIPLNNNAVVEDTLGSHGLVCVEDLVEVLLKGRDNEELFNEVNKLIISFRVNPENRNPGSMFRNERASRGFVPKIETIMGRMV
jgi:large subunit ribosomal protein L7e